MNKLFKKELLRQLDICHNLDNDLIEELSYGMKDEFYDIGSFLSRYGDYANKIIFIADGTACCSIKLDNQEIDIEYLYRGCWVGMYGGFLKFPYGIQVVCETPVNAYSIDISYIEELLPFMPVLDQKIHEL